MGFIETVFSPTPVISVTVTIDDGETITCDNVKTAENSGTKEISPLYLAAWEPQKLELGKTHVMKVFAVITADDGSETTVSTSRHFVLDTKVIDVEGTI